MRNKQEPILNRDKQVTPMKGETSPEDAPARRYFLQPKRKRNSKSIKINAFILYL